MTIQTTKIAMFALAAFALAGMAGTSAFAIDGFTSEQFTVISGSQSLSEEDNACGSPGEQCFHQVDYNSANNSVTVNFGSHNGGTCDKATITLIGPGGPESTFVWNMSGDNYQWTTYGMNVDIDDQITVTGYFEDCS